MSKLSPYFSKRGACYAFRIAVPRDLVGLFGSREITKALPWSRPVAVAAGLQLAAQAKALFNRLRSGRSDPMSKKTPPQDDPFVTGYIFEIELDSFGASKKIKIDAQPHEQAAVESLVAVTLQAAAQVGSAGVRLPTCPTMLPRAWTGP